MNKKKAKNLINSLFAKTGVASLTSRFVTPRGYARILLYHRVNDLVLKESSISDRLTVTADNFRRHMKYVAANFNAMSLPEFVASARTKSEIANRAVIVTFDDGYLDNYRFAFPILKEFNIPATIFLATDYIGSNRCLWWDVLEELVLDPGIELKKLDLLEFKNEGINFAKEDRVTIFWKMYWYLKSVEPSQREEIMTRIFQASERTSETQCLSARRMLAWDQILEMSQHGITFGAHTRSHVVLSKVPLSSAKTEIVNSKNEIERETGTAVTSFAYPNGGLDTFNEDIIDILKKAGYTCAVTTVKGFASPKDDLFRLKRYNIDGEDSFSTFQCKLTGVYELPGLKSI
ncbi:MAG: polysaccharide deacetylase family protein [Candidatus Zhuqueibacterota bacterium]